MHVLVVDEHPQSRAAIQNALEREGCHTHVAPGAEAGLAILGERHIDLVIGDEDLSPMSGTEFLRRAGERQPDAVRVMMSRESDLPALLHALNAGIVHRYLPKPWNDATVRTGLRDALDHVADRNPRRDPVSGWLTRAELARAFAALDPASIEDGYFVVVEIINASSVFSFLNDNEAQGVAREIERRVQAHSPALTDIALLDRGLFAFVIGTPTLDQDIDTLRDLLTRPITTRNARVAAQVRIGIAPVDVAETDIAEYIRKSLIALTSLDGSDLPVQVYSGRLTADLHYRHTLEQDLFSALSKKQMFCVVQPQIRAATGAIAGAELLLRWRHPIHGLISPVLFIELAERTGLIREIGRWTLSEGLDILHRLSDTPSKISVNLSPRQFLSRDLVDSIRGLLDEYGVDATRVQLEVTENSMAHDVGYARRLLEELKNLGIRIALDDFGTGYSSLAQLSHLPLDVLKFDREFICDLETDRSSRMLLQHMVALARDLEFETVAEGVETQGQADVCREVGCDLIQGYFYYRPMSVEDLIALLCGPGDVTLH